MAEGKMRGGWVRGRLIWVTVFCALIFASAMRCGAAEQSAQRKLTLMVYMCGSNLESQYGLASEDIQEMLSAGVDDRDVKVLVMTGGSSNWWTRWGAGNTTILEIGNRKLRAVWPDGDEAQDADMNMGDAKTLSFFLQYGMANYPAEDYALILWNHGGGPMVGVCWDELHSGDTLTLAELDMALKAAELPQKLSWIGFDACLMSSVETAFVCEPYTRYMIASQETEPSDGWNYAFLKGLEGDADGRATGRRIVDAYFDGMADTRDMVTLSCVDLSGMSGIVSAMDDFFGQVINRLNEDSFARLSKLRMAATGFGKSVRSSSDDCYDLVDLSDLVREYGEIPELAAAADGLANAMSEAVTYCRSSEAGACGLSVYHPYVNKNRYLSQWGYNYRKLRFCSGYQDYLNRFGSLLTGKAFADWSDVAPPSAEGNVFSVQLTPEQVAEFSSAQLLILGEFLNSDNEMTYTPLYATAATLSDDGLLTAAYNGRLLYVTNAEGDPMAGPVTIKTDRETGRLCTLTAYINNISIFDSARREVVTYQFDEPADGSDLVETLTPWVWDAMTQTYTHRIPFDESEFPLLTFVRRYWNKPEGEGTLPGFDEWGKEVNHVFEGFFLPQPWRLRFMDSQLSGTRLCATLQITDAQQNQYCTPLVSIPNDNLNALTVSPAVFENDTIRLEFSAEMEIAPLDCNLNLIWQVTNLTDRTIDFRDSPIVLNDSRRINRSLTFIGLRNIAPGETVKGNTSLPHELFYGLDAITTLSFDVAVRKSHTYEAFTEFPVRFDLLGCDADMIRRIADRNPDLQSFQSQTIETEYGRFHMTVQPYSEKLEMLLIVENTSDLSIKVEFEDAYMCERVIGELHVREIHELKPHQNALYEFKIYRNDPGLYDLKTIDSIRCKMRVCSENGDTLEASVLCFEFEDVDISGMVPAYLSVKGEAEVDGLKWQLLSLSMGKEGRCEAIVRIANERQDNSEDVPVGIVVNGVAINTDDCIWGLDAGSDVIRTFLFDTNKLGFVSDIGLDRDDSDFYFEEHLPMDHLLKRQGVDQISSLTFIPRVEGLEDVRLTFTLPEPLSVPGGGEGLTLPDSVPILEGPVHAELYAVALGTKGAGLCMHLANDTDRNVRLQFNNPRIGARHEWLTVRSWGDAVWGDGALVLPAHTTMDKAVQIGSFDLVPGGEIRDMAWEFEYEDGAGEVVVSGWDSALLSEGGIFLTADALKTVPARIG